MNHLQWIITLLVPNRLRSALVLVSLLLAPLAVLSQEEWVRLPASGQGFGPIAVDPADPLTVYVGTAAGVLKATDGGSTWNLFNAGLGTPFFGAASVASLAVDPTNPSIIYAGAADSQGGVYKSLDGALSWTRIADGLRAAFFTERIVALAIDPQAPLTVFAGADTFGFFRTTDGGSTWTFLARGAPFTSIIGPPAVPAIAIDPSAPQRIYVGVRESFAVGGTPVFKSNDGASTWVAASNGLPVDGGVASLTLDRNSPATLYAGLLGKGVYRSTDGGLAWSAANDGIASLTATSIVIDPRSQLVLYASTNGNGVFRSTNAGTTWQPFGNDLPAASPFDSFSLAYADENPPALYATIGSSGVFKLSIPTVPTTAVSNVAFFPGVGGSKLISIFGGIADQFWPPEIGGTLGSDFLKLGTVDSPWTASGPNNSAGLVQQAFGDVYGQFVGFLNDLAATRGFKWKAFPHDWRLANPASYGEGLCRPLCPSVLLDLGIITISDENNNVGNLNIRDEINRLAESSATQKVTIIMHSQGGILVKRLLSKGIIDPNKIDRLIFVATPHRGAANTLLTLLHGEDFPALPRWLKLDFSFLFARDTVNALRTSFVLSPSATYFSESVRFSTGIDPVDFPKSVIEFQVAAEDPEVNQDLRDLISSYGPEINNFNDLESFLTNDARLHTENGQDVSLPPRIQPFKLADARALHEESNTSPILGSIPTYLVVGTNYSTPRAIKYVEGETVSVAQQFTTVKVPLHPFHHDIMSSQYGDGVVMEHSAEGMSSARTWYVNLGTWNSQQGTKHQHRDILGARPVQEIIKTLLDGSVAVPLAVDGVEGAICNQPCNLEESNRGAVSSWSPIDLHAFDAERRHTGPVGATLSPGQLPSEANIPNSDFLPLVGDRQTLSVPLGKPTDFEVRMTSSGTFGLTLQQFRNDAQVARIEFANLPAVFGAATGFRIVFNVSEVTTLPIDTDADGNFDAVAGPVLCEPRTLCDLAPLVVAVGAPRAYVDTQVTLDASSSADPERAPLDFAWRQSGGPVASLVNSTSPIMKFTIPATARAGEALQFQVKATDPSGVSGFGSVTVHVAKLGDVDGDGAVDLNDLNLVLAARNQPASDPNDLRDLNADGKIDALDARKLTTLCTRPRCATQ